MQFDRVLANRENRKSDTPPLGTLTQRSQGPSLSLTAYQRLTPAAARSQAFTKTSGRQHTPPAVWPGQGHSFSSGCVSALADQGSAVELQFLD